MTPKEKAEYLVDKFYQTTPNEAWINEPIGLSEEYTAWKQAKKCALIAVDECIESTKQLIHHYTKGDDKRYADIYLSMSLSVAYLQEVKQEIEKS